LIVEGNRDREFNPVKNKSGADSAETARAALNRIATEWLKESGHSLPEGHAIEISPLQALDAAELKQKLASGKVLISEITAPA
jgi:UDP-N-acetylglucosamine/UDP-N-acetylgalactosamine diphosphorylase